jgi:GNAT superfamily N-acetyltransferase
MTRRLTVERVADLGDADREALRALTAAVYPPDESADWPGRRIEWAPAEWCVRVHDNAGALVSYAGIVVRDATLDDRPVIVGGIGGVKTHPHARRAGLAARAMERAVEFFRDEARADFGLLVCAPHLLAYYGGLGWQEFGGRLLVRQRGDAVDFTFNRVMTLAVRAPAPVAGTIDLLGPPW